MVVHIDGSSVRMAYVSESTIGTTPASPTFKIQRYVDADIKPVIDTDVSDEVRGDGNVPSIIKVGERAEGNINTRYSYGSFHDWLEKLLSSSWNSNAIVNGRTHKAATLEFYYPRSTSDSYIRYQGCRWNSLEMRIQAKQPVRCVWNVMGIRTADPTSEILSGATYSDASTTSDINAALNVGNLAISGLSAQPKLQSPNLRISQNVSPTDVVAQYEPDGHTIGQCQVSGSFVALFSSHELVEALKSFDDLGISFDLQDADGNKETWQIPSIKPLNGGPNAPGNGRLVTVDMPFQAKFNSSIGGSIKITRVPASS